MRRYPKEVHDYIAEVQYGKSASELAELVNTKFGTDFTPSSIKSYRANHKLKGGRPKLPPRYSSAYPKEVVDFIIEHHKGIGHQAMADLVNASFGTSYTKEQMKNLYARKKLNSGLTGRFESGHIPANKGQKGISYPGTEKTQFKKGNLPYSTKPIGYERTTRDGYIEVKVAMRPSNPLCNDNFIAKHRLVWEAANGPIPDGYVLDFKDGNKKNCVLENLILVERAVHLEMTRSKLRSKDPDITETGALVAKIKVAARRNAKGIKSRQKSTSKGG